jgi:hypothetical protein
MSPLDPMHAVMQKKQETRHADELTPESWTQLFGVLHVQIQHILQAVCRRCVW